MADSSESPAKIAKPSAEGERQLAAWLIEQKWRIVDDVALLHPRVPHATATLKPIVWRATQVDVFDLYLPPELWDLLSVICNRNLARRDPRDTRYRTTTPEELRKWYGLQIGLENTWGNCSTDLKEHFAHVKALLHSSGLGYDRFRMISNCICPTVDELVRICQMLQDTFQGQVQHAEIVAIDESVIAYQSSDVVKNRADQCGTPIPIVYMPRKPHPNGLLCYLGCTFVQDPNSDRFLPFIVSFAPHLRPSDYSPELAAKRIIDTWTLAPPHWVVDAAFGSSDLVRYAGDRGGRVTASVSEKMEGLLWKALSFNVPPGCWRAAVRGDGVIASVHCGEADGGRRNFQRVLSSNWTFNSGTSASVVSGSDTETEEESEDDQQRIPQYSRESLANQKLPQLKEICRRWGIRSGKKKAETVDNIMKRVEIVHKYLSEVEKLCRILYSDWQIGAGPVHLSYKASFSWVDRADRKWNSVEEHHQRRDWKVKYLLFVMRFAVLNAMVHSKQNHGEKWKPFRMALAQQLDQTH